MQRRDFMKWMAGSVIVIPAVGSFLLGCGGDDDETPQSEDPGAAPARSGSSTVYTTNAGEMSHVHTFTIADGDLAAPPTAGLSGSTTTGTQGEAHMHTVSITMTVLANVAAGQTVKVTTGDTDGHHHVLTLVKIA